MSRPSRRTATLAGLIAVPAALALSGVIVGQASYSAYSATTVNPTNTWATGTVALADDDNATAAFTVSNLKPGSTGTRCIVVTSTGSLASTVKLYGTTPASTKSLADHITLTVTEGTGGSFGSCTGFTPLAANAVDYSGSLTSFGATKTDFGSGVGTFAPTGNGSESRTYQISYTVSASAPNSTQAGTASLGLTWEAQNS